MTLIISLCRRDLVVHASDRLLTLHPSGKTHDSTSNKTIIYEAHDGICCIGYSGIAYLEGMPTDEWIIRKMFETGWQTIPVERVIQVIKTSIESLSQGIINKGQLMVSMSGYRTFYKNRCFGTFFTRIDRKQGQVKSTIEGCAPRFFYGFSNFYSQKCGMSIDGLGAFVSNKDWADDMKKIEQSCDPVFQENVLVDRIRSVSNPQGTVGPNILTVTMDRLKKQVSVKFHPVDNHWARIEAPSRLVEGNTHHTPWIILRSITKPPTAEIGDSVLRGGNWPINIYGAPPTSNVKGLSTSVKRTPPPR